MHTKFVRKSEWRRQLRRPRHRLEYNIRMNIRKTVPTVMSPPSMRMWGQILGSLIKLSIP